MKVWIDQDLCTGDGLCVEVAPDVFFMHSDGLAYVKEVGKIGLLAGEPIFKKAEGVVEFPDRLLDAVIESADDCPGDCIFIEP